MSSRKKISGIWLLILFAIFLTAGEAMSQDAARSTAPAAEYAGLVKMGFGPYFYIQGTAGFDIAIQGRIQSGDASSLVGKEVRVKGELLADKTSIFRADSIEVKESGSFKSVYTRTADLVLNDYVDAAARETFKEVTVTSALNNEEWEGKGKIKVYGAFQAGSPNVILLTDAQNKEIGKILVDSMTEYATYYMKKLRLFDEFWFYLNVKDTVDKKDRAKSRDLFHADVVFSGLF